MTARVKCQSVNLPAYDYPTFLNVVDIDGRGIYAAESQKEADDLVERVNNYPKMRDALRDAQAEIVRLKARLRKLRQAQRKGGVS